MSHEYAAALARSWQSFEVGHKADALSWANQAFGLQQTPQAAAALGYFLLDSGHHDAAAQILGPALVRHPEYAPLQWYMGLFHRQVGNATEAAAFLRRACQLDGSLYEPATTLAWTLNDLGQLDEASVWAERALALRRRAPQLLLMGWLCQQQGSLHEAAGLYREAMTDQPLDAAELRSLHLHLAQCLTASNQQREAERTLLEGLRHLPDDPELSLELIHLHWQRDHRTAAIALAMSQTQAHPDRPDVWYLLGALQQESGDLQAADASFHELQQRAPARVDGLLRRAQIQSSLGNPDAAHWLLELVLDQQPQWQPAQALRAQVLLDLRRTSEARRLLLSLLRKEPDLSELWRLLAVAGLQGGRRRAAMRALRRSLRLDAANVESLRTLGWIALEVGDLETAQGAVLRLQGLRPDEDAAKIQAAFVYGAAGRLGDAEKQAKDAVALSPKNAEAWRALSDVRYRQGRLSEAESSIDVALDLQPGRVDSLRQLGWILMADQRFGQAQLAFLRAQELKPEDPVSSLELAEARLRAGDFVRGLETLGELLQRQPHHWGALLLKARLLTEGSHQLPDAHEQALILCRRLLVAQQRVGEAVRVLVRLLGLGVSGAQDALNLVSPSLRQAALRDALADGAARHGHFCLKRLADAAVQTSSMDTWASCALLYSQSLADGVSAEDLTWSARDLYRQIKLRAGLDQTGRRRGHRLQGARLRLAYIVSQLHVSLLRRVIASHDPEQTEIFVYSSRPLPPLPGHIHCEPLELETLAAACAVNRIDVVIDTGGLHPFEGQMGLLHLYARRLAPLQVGWLGCWGSAGGLFDALLTDSFSVPVDHAPRYEEALWRLEGGQWCWDPPVHAPPVGPVPALGRGFVTFGVVARGLRLNRASLEAWARILVASPRSRMRFVGHVAHDWPQRAEILSTLEGFGVNASRIAFDPPRSYEGLLAWFQEIDLVLDTFPGNGGLSLLDSLWMGVPVITRAGHWAGARQAGSILSALGLSDWVTGDASQYVTTAVALASNSLTLARYRSDLRSLISSSPLVDGRRVASQIEWFCEAFVTGQSAGEKEEDPKDRLRAQARRSLGHWLDQAGEIRFFQSPAAEAPDLTVIVVLYNQAGLSRRTLQALADQRGASFETIIVDNASSDETAALLKRVHGARILSNAHNAGFLLAVNQAAALARGRHLVLLNSDAILQKGALAAACKRLDADPSIGALGGRIVLTAGGLQEAGNRIFRDGSTLGIGRGEDPFCPAAMASRTADYVSGVFLAVPVPVWRALGGFDEAYVPAYYEDTDFCLRIWHSGFRVVYEPEVLVEHVEWGSAAGDEAPRQMRENQQRFLLRHGSWLKGQPDPSPQRLDGDRWCSPEDVPRRPRVLILDNEVPHMVRGGGLPRARSMLQALDNWPVTFYPLWVCEDEWQDVYASLPRSVEVMLDYGWERLESFLETRQGLYDVLLISRPPNLKAIEPLRRRRPELFRDMRLVYDAEALFALREIAEAAVKARPMSRASAQACLAAEIGLARDADHVLVVSERDAALFRAAGHSTSILSHAIPVRKSVPGPQLRHGMLFVGALHPDTPNEDGLVWFIRCVMPLLREWLNEDPVLSVVGINRSTRVSELAGPHVRLLGPQQSLEPHYDRARVFVAPVRFAGGVPAKVIEAAAHGVPVVASAVLARQLQWCDGVDLQAARNADAFARRIAYLMRDDALWLRQQNAAWNQCSARYDPERFGQALRGVLASSPGANG